MNGKIRLGCQHCDRSDFDGVDKLPKDWDDVSRVRSLKEALREVDKDDTTRSVFDWQTHLGTCPECKAIHG